MYEPSKLIKANPDGLSGLLLVTAREPFTGTHFFEFVSEKLKDWRK